MPHRWIRLILCAFIIPSKANVNSKKLAKPGMSKEASELRGHCWYQFLTL
jgi:hypothetical protein